MPRHKRHPECRLVLVCFTTISSHRHPNATTPTVFVRYYLRGAGERSEGVYYVAFTVTDKTSAAFSSYAWIFEVTTATAAAVSGRWHSRRWRRRRRRSDDGHSSPRRDAVDRHRPSHHAAANRALAKPAAATAVQRKCSPKRTASTQPSHDRVWPFAFV
jgi:hypothetical protein